MRLILLPLLLLAATAALAQAPAPTALAAEPIDAKVIAWRRDIHQHPELGNRELRTAKLVADHLRRLGLDVRTGIAHTGVVAILRGGKPGPRIALRADMDALPLTEQVQLPFASKVSTLYKGETVGVMHACGHDGHTAILMGVAEQMAAMRKELRGEVLFVFQPAEEGAPAGETGGAAQMLAEGLFADFKPEAAFGLHVNTTINVGEIGYRSGPFMAGSDSFTIKVKGRGTHGARPWLGADPIVAAAAIVTAAQSIVSRRIDIARLPVVLTFGAIRGGNRGNVIPDEVELIGTIRSFDPQVREQLFAELRRVAEGVAAAHGATVDAQIPDGTPNPVVVNDPALVARSLPALQRAGNAHEIPLVTGSEDFAYYAQAVPSLFFFVGVVPAGQDPATAASNHSPRFFLDESALAVGRRALLGVALDYLNASPVTE
jgi:amidohydrolase